MLHMRSTHSITYYTSTNRRRRGAAILRVTATHLLNNSRMLQLFSVTCCHAERTSSVQWLGIASTKKRLWVAKRDQAKWLDRRCTCIMKTTAKCGGCCSVTSTSMRFSESLQRENNKYMYASICAHTHTHTRKHIRSRACIHMDRHVHYSYRA